MSNLLKKNTSVHANPSLTLNDDDYKQDTPRYSSDYKQDRVNDKIKMDVLTYFEKYPTFKNGLFTNDHIQKLCIVVEKFAFYKKADKLKLVIEIMEILNKGPLLMDQKNLVCNTIEFLHRSKLIDVKLYKKILHYIMSIFR